MSVKIRLQRCGRPKKPSYRIVVIDSKRQRDSKPIEFIGHYNPMDDKNIGAVDSSRVDYWLKNGAKPSDRVSSILKKLKVKAEPKEGE